MLIVHNRDTGLMSMEQILVTYMCVKNNTSEINFLSIVPN